MLKSSYPWLYLTFFLCVTGLTGCLATPSPPPPPSPSPTPAPPEFAVIGYLPGYRMLNPEWGRYVTDVVFFSAGLSPNGDLDARRLTAHTLAALHEMRAAYGTRLYLAIGGWGRSQHFDLVATDPALRASLAQTLTTYCLQNGLDGIDFDWEFPQDEAENAGYVALLTEVRAAFAPHNLRVSVALSPWQDLGPGLYAAVDRIHIMAYDHEGQHSTFPQAAADVQAFLKRGAPPAQLALGLPFYGRNVKAAGIEKTYAQIVNTHHPAPDVDEVDNLYFNGPATIQQKVRHAQEQGLGGVMIWELGQDTVDDTSLLRAIQEALETP